MEQTFEEQCKQDSRLAIKIAFVALNISRLNLIEERLGNDIAPGMAQCFYCNKIYKNKIGSYTHRSGIYYCSALCKTRLANSVEPRLEKCFMCKKYFILHKYEYQNRKNKDKISCSIACANKAKKVPIKIGEYTCSFCGVVFKRRASFQRSRTPCCTHACAARKTNQQRAKAAAAPTEERHQASLLK